ncbi:MAG: hypothetical protein WCO82_10605 [Sphingomonadales bacterium]|jgi:hypothetical protein
MPGSSVIAGLCLMAGLALVAAGGWALTQRGVNRLRAGLMVVAGLVILANAWLLATPLL